MSDAFENWVDSASKQTAPKATFAGTPGAERSLPGDLPGAIRIRPSVDADVDAMVAIYGHAVLHDTGTFETQAPSAAEFGQRRADVLAKGWPWLVAERSVRPASPGAQPELLAYAYASQFRPRPAYRLSLEDSIYVAPASRGLGIGRLLLAELIARCEARGARQMLAVIGDTQNHGSVRLHCALGFTPVGTFKDVGHKFDRWIDVVLLQRSLGPGASTPPTDSRA